jgi:hypothetical protein
LAIREIVETVVDFCVGREIGQKDVKIVLICAIGCVVAFIVYTKVAPKLWLAFCLRYNNNEENIKKRKR